MEEIKQKEPLGKFVERRRKALRLTQTELASYVGYSPQAFSKFESGRLSISLLVAPSLANALSLSLDDLFARREKETQIVNKPIDPQTVSVQLSFFRNAKGIHQKDFASKIGASIRSLRSYELGDSVPSITIIDRLLGEYGIEASEILYPNPMMMNTRLASDIRSGQIRTERKKALYASLLGVFSCLVIGVGVGVGGMANAGYFDLAPFAQAPSESEQSELSSEFSVEESSSKEESSYTIADVDPNSLR